MLLKEVCVENFERIPAIIAAADRIELCDNLAEGGTSVSLGVAKQTAAFCAQHKVPVMAMVRPRKGDFVFNEAELAMMLTDVQAYKDCGITGLVFGCLTAVNTLDEEKNKAIIAAAAGMDLTFHMAFDELSDPFKAIDWLADHGVTRILTHGGPLTTAISDHLAVLKAYQNHANERLVILPGGGITKENMHNIAHILEVTEVHGTRLV
ncbi:copper homeostasis protein CutC [Brochothrix campestris]|uniref:PF03932 family protein CutC n=1 Tax=Brochothrix campestris FSL F6-1037 TaxID=1265861 RepID=W7CS71_9LIST|nr:copper homeostasis protein CutC [Brochothrix campestris]EUJ38616.1 cytoplasmic copper homeostasis protein CutC [Brochothrix campestris FSL F6-1037]